jgi:hypothetical protein
MGARKRKRNNGNIIVGWFVVYCTLHTSSRKPEEGKERLVGRCGNALALQV